MLSNLQAQQKLLQLSSSPPPRSSPSLPSSLPSSPSNNNIKDFLSPLSLAGFSAREKAKVGRCFIFSAVVVVYQCDIINVVVTGGIEANERSTLW